MFVRNLVLAKSAVYARIVSLTNCRNVRPRTDRGQRKHYHARLILRVTAIFVVLLGNPVHSCEFLS